LKRGSVFLLLRFREFASFIENDAKEEGERKRKKRERKRKKENAAAAAAVPELLVFWV